MPPQTPARSAHRSLKTFGGLRVTRSLLPATLKYIDVVSLPGEDTNSMEVAHMRGHPHPRGGVQQADLGRDAGKRARTESPNWTQVTGRKVSEPSQ